MDDQGNAYGDFRDRALPLKLPELEDFKPTGTPEPPLSKAKDWIRYSRSGENYTRETNTMPQWAGSCWYYLRYADPANPDRFVDPEKEKYWMPVDLYVGGVEHAVLHLLYSRFWHKVLFDLGFVSTAEPFKRLVNQGLILGEMEYHVFKNSAGQLISTGELRDIDEEAKETGVEAFAFEKKTGNRVVGSRVSEDQVEKSGDSYRLKSEPNIRVDAAQLQDEQEPGECGEPGFDRRRLRRRYVPALRDVPGTVGSAKAVEHARHRWNVPVPQQRLAESRGRS